MRSLPILVLVLVTSALPAFAGVGIHSAPAHRGNVVMNGRVRGMYVHGVMLQGEGSRLERVIGEENCFSGLWVGTSGMVIESQALRNSTGQGIVVDGGLGVVTVSGNLAGRSAG